MSQWPRPRPASRIHGSLPRGVSERQARRLLLERKVAAFDLIAEGETGQASRNARMQAADALEQLAAWHRQDLDQRLTVEASPDASIEGYRFALDGRQVAELFFTAEASADDTGWFRCPIDATALEAAPTDMWRWIGDPWPVDVAGVEVDQLVELGHRDGRAAMLDQARATVERTRSQALAVARGDLLNDLAGGNRTQAPEPRTRTVR
jgi:hypothetical protein